MGELLTPTHLMVVAAVGLLLFGGKKLPEIGRGLGDGLRGFQDGIRGLKGEVAERSSVTQASTADAETAQQG